MKTTHTKNLLNAMGLTGLLKKLFNYFSIFTIVIGSIFGTLNSAYAADGDDGTGEVVDGASITATDANGIVLDADGDGAIAVSIDPDGGITLGTTNDDDAITSDSSGALATTFTITDSDTGGDTLTIAGDIDIGDADNDDTMIINSTNANLLIQNDIIVGNTANTIAINLGSGGDVTMTVDNDVNEEQSIAATIDGNATNTVTLAITDTIGSAQLQIFSKAIGGTTALDAININPTDDETAEVKFQAGVAATTITLGNATDAADDDTTVTFEAQTADYTVTGTIDNAVAADETAIHVTDATASAAPDTVTFASNIGSTIAVDAITVGSATTGGDAIFSGNVSATAFSVLGGNHADEDNKADMDGNLTAAVTLNDATGTATLTFTGAAAQEMTGAIVAASDGEGILTTANTGGAVTFDAIGTDAAKLTSATIAASNEAIFGGAVAANTLTINGTATIQAADNESETFAMGASSVLYVDKTLTTTNAVINEVATTRPTLTSGAKVYMPENLSDGQTLTLFIGEANNGLADHATTVTETNAALQDNALLDYVATAVTTGNGSTLVTASAKTESTTATELSVTTNQARALKQALTSAISDTTVDGTAEDAMNAGLNGIGYSALEDTNLAKQVSPQTDLISGSTIAAQAVTGSVQGIMSSRMASLRSGDAYFGTGVAAGGMSAQSGFIQVFGSTAEQNNKTVGSGTQYGYESDTEGLAIGFDGVTDDGMTIGVSLATANTDVDGKGTGKSTNSIDTYSASLYMDRATDAGYVEGSVTFGLNENSTSRKVNSAGLDRTYTGSYDSQSLSVNISAGAPNEVGNGYLTPFGSFTASFMDIDAYTEKSTVANDALRLKVAQDDINSMIGTLGLKYHAEMGNGGTPMISLAINNEFGDTTINSTNTYQGGGTAFKTSTVVEELSATLGLGYSYGSDATSIELAYEADVNDDEYLSHYGSIKIVGKF